MQHGGLVPGQSPFRLAVLAKLGLQKSGDASRNLPPVGRWEGTPGICDVQERQEPDVFPHLLEHIGQPYSWGPQPSIHRRVHTELLALSLRNLAWTERPFFPNTNLELVQVQVQVYFSTKTAWKGFPSQLTY